MSGADMLFEVDKKSNMPKDRLYLWFAVATSCLFTALIITHSLRQGRLSLPASYDDVIYFIDAADRLQTLYDNGVGSCFASLFHNPSHAPLATFLYFVGFAVFGIHDWAPCLVNVVWVAVLLIFVKLLLQDLPRWADVTIALTVLAWPLAGEIVVQCRPDIFTSLLTVMGCALMFRSPFLQAPTSHVAIGAALFGAALVAKPSISPLTLVIYCASLLISIITDGHPLFDRVYLSNRLRRVAQYFAVTTITALPYFAFAWRDTYDYIYLVLIGQKERWAVNLDMFDAAGYYLWGPGGGAMMGHWFWITIFLVAVAALLSLARQRSINQQTVGLFVVFLFAYAVVSINTTKTAYLGVIVSTFFLAFYVMACGSIIRLLLRLGHYGRWAAVGLVSVLLLTSATAFVWPSYNYKNPSSHLEAGGYFEILRRAGDYFELHSQNYAEDIIVFPVISWYFNPNTLRFEFQKRGLRMNGGLSFLGSLNAQTTALATADHVILFDEDDPEILRYIPGASLYNQVRPLVVGDPAFKKDLVLQSADETHSISIYSRKRSLHPHPFAKMHPIAGFLPIEGPFPQWKLPLVRWAQGSSARALFLTDTSGAGQLTMRARSSLAGQSIEVKIDGEDAGNCDLAVPNVFINCSLPVKLMRPATHIELRFSKSGSQEDGMRSVLFSKLQLDPES
jgi:hypothetical protein